jgi:glycosyltransferase involved in cell wall biosynthesis
MSPLRIVLVLVDPPQLTGSATGRWYYVLLKGLVQRGHRVTAFVACSRPEDRVTAEALFPAPEFDLRCYEFSQRSGIAGKWQSYREPYSYVYSPELRRDLDETLAAGFDVLHLETQWGGWLGREHAGRSLLNIHYLYEIDWAESEGGSVTGGLLRGRTLATERSLLKHYPFIRTLTPRLSAAARQRNPGAQVETIPLAFDVSLCEFQAPRSVTEAPAVGLIGSFNWRPTYSAAVRLITRLWPRIKEQVPSARLMFTGREARTALKDFLDVPSVEITDAVPDIIPYLRALDVMVYAPSRGSGMKVKILEALAYGVPVVTTSEGVEGLNAVDGVHVGLCEDDEGLIERTVALLTGRERAIGQAVAARKLIETDCDPERALEAIERVYARISRQ